MYNPTKPYKEQIIRLIKSTWQTPYVSVASGIYPIIKKKFRGLEIQHTDGIGTKGIYHLRKRTFKNAVIDALAMNANDLAMAGAIPYALQDHIVLPEAGAAAILEIVRALTALCRMYKIAITGGETSHHDNLDALDIGVTISGFLARPRINKCRAGDVLIGLPSNGLHANGFSRVRGLFGVKEWREDFIRPTYIYLNTVLNLLKRYEIHGMMHITGGAFAKLRDILGTHDALIEFPQSFKPRAIFYELHERGVSSRQMYTTFNCGIGFVFSLAPHDVKEVLRKVRGALIIGVVKKGSGVVRIKSIFDGKIIRL
ncbi:hypothetical protein HY091_00435 [Candidatus Kaiserbacteria bacterium]|nr:hypothetical protein [Candidatus Kaiserbacteria bacterium]